MCLLLVAACSDGGSSSSATGSDSTTTADAAVDEAAEAGSDLTDYLDDEGVLGLAAALQVFAATFAPLPGVLPAPVPVLDSDTHVLSLIANSRKELTDDQWAVVQSVLGGPGIPLDQLGGPTPPTGRRPSGARSDVAAPVIRAAIEEWTRRLGRPLSGGPAMLTVVELPMVNPDTGVKNFSNLGNAATAVQLLEEGAFNECLIRLNIDTPFNVATFDSQVSHEVFHCFQYDLVDTNPIPKWIVEGMAAYAGEIFAGGSAQSSSWWARWIGEPTRPLTGRTYDAIGLFSASESLGVDPFGYADELLRTATFTTVEAATGVAIRDRLGAHYANEPDWGASFTVIGPAAPATRVRRSLLTWAGATASFPRAIPPGSIAASPYTFSAPGEVLIVSSLGFGGVHFSNGASALFGGAYLGAFCLLPGGCVCPGEAVGRPGLVAASPDGFVGIGPGDTPEFTSQSLEEYCAASAPDSTLAPDGPAGDGCLVGQWQVDNERMSAEFSRVITTATPGSSAAGFVSSEVTGSWVMSLTADGAMVMKADNWALAGTSLAPPGLDSDEEVQVVVTISFGGTVTGTYTGSGGSLLSTSATGGLTANATLTLAGQTINITSPQLATLPVAAGSASTYRCTSNSLSLTPMVANAVAMYFVRVG